MRGPLVIKIVGNSSDPERMTTGLSVAGAADAAGIAVSLWLAGDAVWLAVRPEHRRAAVDGEAADLLIDLLPQAGAAVCARCAQRRAVVEEHLAAGARIAGAAEFVAAATQPEAQALVY
jgi:predicted peroxiredoxin